MVSLVKSIHDQPDRVIKQCYLPIFKETWLNLIKIFKERTDDTELVAAATEQVLKSTEFLQQEVVFMFSEIQDTLLACFMANKANFCCINAYATICEVLSKKSPEVKQLINSLTENVLQLLTNQIFINSDASQPIATRLNQDIAQSISLVIFAYLKIDPVPFITCRYFNEIMQLISQILVEVTNKELQSAFCRVVLKLVEIVRQLDNEQQQL